MLFSSLTFLYLFLPAVLLAYAVFPARLRNGALLAASLLFYFCGEPEYTLLILGETLVSYLIARWMAGAASPRLRRALLAAELLAALGALGLFKYADFAIGTVNALFGGALPLLHLALPIGISFYTFQTLSYVIDVYWGRLAAERNFVRYAAYVTLFPQLIAGPIVRYQDVAEDLCGRRMTADGLYEGLSRFVLGLSKKVLLANVLGQLVSDMTVAAERSVLGAWLLAVGYALQIYFDFSGYSDMAIGIGRVFGLRFPENFNYPYLAHTVTDFWRRWHMTLSSWFRDYVYIPLGGNRRGLPRQLCNILIVWTLTGLWHGANWTFAAWGMYFALLLTLEKLFLLRVLERLPRAVGRIYTLLAVLLSFVLFQSERFSAALALLSEMFGAAGTALQSSAAVYALRSYGLLLLMGCIGATPLPKKLAERLGARRWGAGALRALTPAVLLLLLLLCTAYLADGSFNPFLYFRF